MTISKTNFFHRITKYCADSERCTNDVLVKLEAWGVPVDEIDEILSKLYAEKFVDDERYAKKYVAEKWNLDRWGKIKIANALQQKKLNAKIINNAMLTIDDEDYIKGLDELLQKKQSETTSENNSDDARRIMMFALSRGFEEELIMEWLHKEGYET